jgi:hypothetical protein
MIALGLLLHDLHGCHLVQHATEPNCPAVGEYLPGSHYPLGREVD